MFNNLLLEVSNKSHCLFEEWKYLLLQEKCRLCTRLIHPLINKMDFETYSPPANYLVNNRRIVSDVLCQFCLPVLADCQAVLNSHQYFYQADSNPVICDLKVASGAFFIEPIDSLIYRLKYSEDVLLGKDLACLMYRAWQLLKAEIAKGGRCEEVCLVPVPLHKKRLNERGFNQAEVLAQQLSSILSIKVESKLLCRIRNTASQQKLSKVERARNVVAAFKVVNDEAFVGKKVILVDDVCTSAATLTECAKAMKAGGAEAIHALTVAFVP